MSPTRVWMEMISREYWRAFYTLTKIDEINLFYFIHSARWWLCTGVQFIYTWTSIPCRWAEGKNVCMTWVNSNLVGHKLKLPCNFLGVLNNGIDLCLHLLPGCSMNSEYADKQRHKLISETDPVDGMVVRFLGNASHRWFGLINSILSLADIEYWQVVPIHFISLCLERRKELSYSVFSVCFLCVGLLLLLIGMTSPDIVITV